LLEQQNAQKRNTSNASNTTEQSKEGMSTLSMLLKSELLGVEGTGSPRSADRAEDRTSTGGSPSRNLFRFKAPRQAFTEDAKKTFSLSPVGTASQRLLSSPRKAKRKIPKVPFKVLDAPALQDDFYLNLVDWSSLNVLAVGLGPCVYLWSACTSKVTKLCDLGPDDCVTSVSWTQRGTHLAVGTNLGEVQIWEASRCKKLRTMGGHSARVGTMAWNAHILASGSRDRLIYQRDVRVPEPFLRKLIGHKQEVCGLRWSFDDQQV
jgi:cell division cycle 20-like protein 1 (cofactor of APC complex)